MNKYINILIVVIGSIFLSSTSQASIIKEESAESLGFMFSFEGEGLGNFGFTFDTLLPEFEAEENFDLVSFPTYFCNSDCPIAVNFKFEVFPDFFNYSIGLEFEESSMSFISNIRHPDEHIYSQVGTYGLLDLGDDPNILVLTVSEIVAPESVSAPGTLALFGSMLGLVGWSARRRRAVNA